MSTILKALRRLEEDSSLDASTPGDPTSLPNSLPATDPNATDELRNRILAEESAAQASGTDLIDTSTSQKRVRLIAAIAGVTLAIALIVVGLVLGFTVPASGPDSGSDSNVLASASRPAPRSKMPSPPSPPGRPSGRPLPLSNPSPSPRSLPPANPDVPQQSPPSPNPPTPFAVSAERAPSAARRSESQPSAGQDAGVAAIPIAQSASTPGTGDSSPPAAVPAPQQTASIPAPAQPTGRLTPISTTTTPTPSEEISTVAVARTPPVPEAESAIADPPSADPGQSVPSTVASTPRSNTKPAPTLASTPASTRSTAQSQATLPVPVHPVHPAPAVSAAQSSTKPPAKRPLKATAEVPPKPSADSAAQATLTTVEEHEGPAIPDVTVLRTAWHPSPERRSAKIRLMNSKKTLNLKEGDAVGGLVIQEISPSAVIFRSGEIELRLRVGQPGSGG